MKVTINQPYFLSYVGLMEKAKFADLFIVNDFAPISSARRIHRRVKILGDSGGKPARYLTELVYRRNDGKSFNSIFLDDNFYRRMGKLINAIQHIYGKSKFFSYLAGDLYEQMERRDFKTLGEFNFNLIKFLLDKLEIRTKIVLASKFTPFCVNSFQQPLDGFTNRATSVAFRMCQLAGATTYVSGQSGPKYLDETPFIKSRIKILYQKINFQPYPQFNYRGRGFLPGLSVVDLIFNCGPEAKNYIGTNSVFLTKI